MKAVVLLSGGMDSATTLYIAKEEGYKCLCLIFDYGQVHKREILSAVAIAEEANCGWELLKLRLSAEGSALLGKGEIPRYTVKHGEAAPVWQYRPKAGKDASELSGGIPSTYVPARNTIFLSMGVSWAESIGAEAVFIGAHLRDALGYPDCRPGYFRVFRELVQEATRDKEIEIRTPVIEMTKREIVEKGLELRVPFQLTWSCYKGGESPCGECGACVERKKGFEEAGPEDPLTAGSSLLVKVKDTEPKAEISEVFTSIQGEGPFLGQRHLFVRFSGCNLNCTYCDEKDKEKTLGCLSIDTLLERIANLKEKKGPVSYIAITGGEPLLQVNYLKALLPELKRQGERIYLETNGTLPDELKEVILWIGVISMDIKLPSATGEDIWRKHERFLKISDIRDVLVKVVVEIASGEEEFRRAVEIVRRVNHRIPLVIQPAWPLPAKGDRSIFLKLERFQALALQELEDVRIIPQVHKLMGLR